MQPPAFGASSCLVFGLVETTVYENLRNNLEFFFGAKVEQFQQPTSPKPKQDIPFMDYIDAGEYHIIKAGNMNKRKFCINPHSKMHGPGKSFCGL